MTNNSDSASLQSVPLSRRISVTHVTLALTALLLFDGFFYWFAVHPLDARKQEVITAIKVLEKQVRQRVETVEHVNSAVKRIESARLIGSNLMKNILRLSFQIHQRQHPLQQLKNHNVYQSI